MAASETEICNLAMSHLGVSKEIANVETERSQEAAACRRFYDNTRDQVFRDFNWPFATKIETLALVETDPNDEWAYSYRYPSDCLKVRRILSGVRNDTADTRVPYKIARDDSGLLLYTDLDDATIEYTVRVEDIQQYPPDFVMALSFKLASYIAPRVTGGDPFKMGERAVRFYDYEISKAESSAINEEQPDAAPESSFITARE